MKTLSNYFFVICFLLGFCACNKKEIRPYSVLPEPQQVEYTNGSFNLKDKLTIAFPYELANEAAYCRDAINRVSTVNPILKEGEKSGNITLALDASVLPEHPEGYVLDIQSKGIVIKANAPAGILHGIQTLRQLIGTTSGQTVETWRAASLQCGTITDYPALGWRAFMLDEARHFQGKEVVLKLLDNMSRLKMNVFHWHLVDNQGWRIEIKKYPELTKTGAARDNSSFNKSYASFYTQEEIREVVAYASARHITIVPEIEIPGHSNAAIASYPWLGSGEVLNLTNPAVEDFIKDILEEVIALFPGNVIHIGGDEVDYKYWKNTPSIAQYMQANNILSPADLQVGFTNRIADWLAAKNRRIMGWNEVLGKVIPDYWRPMLPEDHITKQPLTSNAIVHCWEGNIDLIRETIREGYDIVNSFHLMTYLDLLGNKYIPLEKAYSFQPVPEGLTAEQQKKVLGLGCQMWTERVPDEQDMNKKVYPRIAAYAECGWTAPEKKDYNSFLKRLDYFLAAWKEQRGWTLAWEENFDGNSFDTSRWSKIPRGNADWMNYMSDYDSCYQVADGHLILRGLRNTNQPNDTAAFLTGGIYTKDKVGFGNGRIEIRAKLGKAQGAWPAFWLLPFDNGRWPDDGEIDIMERLNGESIAYQTVHSAYTYKLGIKDPPQGATGAIDADGYNVYAVELHPDYLSFYINDVHTFTYPRIETDKEGQFPFNREFYLLLDMQLGGSWVGKVEPADLPVEMQIDWVRFYNNNNNRHE